MIFRRSVKGLRGYETSVFCWVRRDIPSAPEEYVLASWKRVCGLPVMNGVGADTSPI